MAVETGKIAFSIFWIVFIASGPRSAEADNKQDSLMGYLKHLNANRHHVTNPAGKKQARAFIGSTMTSLGLHTWTEQFKPDFPQVASGVNVVGMLPGRLAGTRDDRPILIGAHYDTMRTTQHGSDDDGSGVAALLQIAKQLTSSTTGTNCNREYSVLLVSFDFEEWEDCTAVPKCACQNLGCGSRAFTANLTKHYAIFTNMSIARDGKLQGAIIMDTMLNYNSTPFSQNMPSNIRYVFGDIYKNLEANKFRGDFLSLTGRLTDDAQLLDTFSYHYKGEPRTDKYKLYTFPLPFHAQPRYLSPSMYNSLSNFFRSDHVNFWNLLPTESAIFLSDTANQRGYMRACYHQDCDNLGHVTPASLDFLAKSCDAITITTNDLTKYSCDVAGSTRDNLTINGYQHWEVALIVIGTVILVLLIAGAVLVFIIRRRFPGESFINQDQLGQGQIDKPLDI